MIGFEEETGRLWVSNEAIGFDAYEWFMRKGDVHLDKVTIIYPVGTYNGIVFTGSTGVEFTGTVFPSKMEENK